MQANIAELDELKIYPVSVDCAADHLGAIFASILIQHFLVRWNFRLMENNCCRISKVKFKSFESAHRFHSEIRLTGL